MRKLGIFVVALMVIGLAGEARAQDYAWGVRNPDGSRLTASQIDEQVESLLNLFSALAGAGFVNTADVHGTGRFDIRATGVFTPIPDEFKDIVPSVQDPLEGASYVPFAFLQGNVGLVSKVEAFGRFMTLPIKGDPGGNVTLLGGGLKYGLLSGNLAMPAISVLAGYQTIVVPEEFYFGTISTISLKAFISKGFAIVTLYGGGGLDRTSLTLDIPGFPSEINKGYNVTYGSGTVGLAFSPIPFFKVNLDANFGTYRSYALAASLGL